MERRKSLYIDFPNTGIDGHKWAVKDNDDSPIETMGLLIVIVGAGLGFLINKVATSLNIEESFLSVTLLVVIFSGLLIGSLYLINRWLKNIKQKSKSRIEAYRKDKLPLLVEGLAEHGIRISNSSISTMHWNNSPTLIDNEGNIYWSRGISINDSTVSISATLEEISDEAMQSDSEELLKDYEKENGDLSDKDRELFMTAAQIGFKHAEKIDS